MLPLVHLIYMAGDKCMRQNACCLYHDSYHGIELQVPSTPQLVKRGVDLIQALWKQG